MPLGAVQDGGDGVSVRSIGELTVDVRLSIDEKTAITCLKLVELYVNQTGADIIGEKANDGSIAYRYEYGFDDRMGARA